MTWEEKKIAFYKGMEEIEAKHIDFFKNSPARLSNQPHDRLIDRLSFNLEANDFKFLRYSDGDIPDDIQRETKELFERVRQA